MKILNRLFPEVKTQQVQSNLQDKGPKGLVLTKEEEQIQGIFEKHNMQATEAQMTDIKAFIKTGEGDMASKLATVDFMLEKGIEINAKHLSQVHMALTQTMDLDYSKIFPPLEKVVSDLPKEIQEVVKDYEGETLPNKVTSFVKSELMALFTVEMSKAEEGLPEKALDLEESQEENLISMTDMPLDEEAFMEALQEIFSELSDEIDHLAEMLTPALKAEFFTEDLPTQKYLLTEVTVKMQEAQKTFEIYQKAVDHQLDQVIKSPENKVQIKEILASAIDKLDHIIMKTDVPMHADMKTERNLLRSSSRLEQARVLVDKDIDRAIELVKSVKTELDQTIFKPKRQKMYGVSQKILIQDLYEKNMIQVPLEYEPGMKTSPRAVMETLRGLGFNHEAEVSELLNKQDRSEFKSPMNMKAVLLKLDEASQKVISKDQFDMLTGNQLMNKLEVKSPKQSMVFQMNVKIDGDTKHLKVHVNAKKTNEKIDWQNSRLYFVIHLNKLGDTGVLVDVNRGKVHITIKNDLDNVESLMKPYVDQAMTRLEDVGFQASSIKFERLYKEEAKSPVKMEKEGFDVSI